MKKAIIFLFLSFFSFIQAQNIFKTNYKVSEVLDKFSSSELEWAVPVSNQETINIQWKERKSSFSKKENFRIFVGYYKENFISTISFSSSKISGHIQWDNKDIELDTSDDGYLIIKSQKTDEKCGVHTNENDFTQHKSKRKKNSNKDDYIIPDVVLSDGVLRIYRLALPISSVYYLYKFNEDISKIKQFWAQMEVHLNEIYTRDIGVKFKIIDDEKLIYKSKETDPFYEKNAYTIIEKATTELNQLIGKNNYDLGLIVTNSTSNGIAGLAGLTSVYQQSNKANAMASANPSTIAHEIGHMFGSAHTFSEGGSISYLTEVGRGQSLMSYSRIDPRDFFSMVSILRIWRVLSKSPYYSDEARTILIPGTGDINNIPYGIKTNNTAPVINTFKLHDSYTIPKNTFFQFNIPAKDAEQKNLLYYAHPADVRLHETKSNANFLTFKPTKNNNVAFQTTYGKINLAKIPYSEPSGTGEYTFWLGVSDFDPKKTNHATLHDMFITKLKVIDGTPFKITSDIKSKYHAGEKVTLQWSVDPMFEGTNVRILMSDDYGETFKHTLISSTENDGSCQITIPNVKLGKKVNYEYNGNPIFEQGAGLFKIEVIDNIAFALSNNSPMDGGFEVENTNIIFHNLPENNITVGRKDIPQKAEITASSQCNNSDMNLNVLYKETGTDTNLITRSWTTTDNCGNTAEFVQKIHIKELIPLHFVENLPKNMELSCDDELPEVPKITAEGGCGTPLVKYSDVKIEGNCRYTWKRNWTATSECSDPISYSQLISISDNDPPKFDEPLPPKILNVSNISQVPYKEHLTAQTDNCSNTYIDNHIPDEEIKDTDGNIIQIIRKWKTEDDCLNQSFYTQTINIENNKPAPLSFVEELPSDISVECHSQIPPAKTLSTKGGNCNSKVTFNESKKTIDCKSIITRSWSAQCGNEAISHSQLITVLDSSKPSFVLPLPSDISVYPDQIPMQENLSAIDNCSTEVSVIPSKQEIREDGVLKKLLYTWTATDDCGNSNVHTQTISIKHKPLSFVEDLPTDITLECHSQIPPAKTLSTKGGNCNSKVIFNESKKTIDCKSIITRSWSAQCGNEAISHSQLITVLDSSKPSFVLPLPSDISVYPDQIPMQENLSAIDNCSKKVSVVPSKHEVKENGILKKLLYTWTATDDCGNSNVHTQTISIKHDTITLYPNPVYDNFKLSDNSKVINLKLFNINGKLVKEFTKKQNTYDISELANGSYILIINFSDNSNKSIKIIKAVK